MELPKAQWLKVMFLKKTTADCFCLNLIVCLTHLLFLQISYQAQLCAELQRFTTFCSPELPLIVNPKVLGLGSSLAPSTLEDFSKHFAFPTLVAFVAVKSHPCHWSSVPTQHWSV